MSAPKKFKAKKFRVAVEGATTDGRVIQRNWITEMAASYDPKVYAARVNLEHYRSISPDSTFRSYGDITALETSEITEGALKGKLALFATIEPLPELVAMTTKLKQKIFGSIEVNTKFSDTGKAYLTGMAVTDTPASLGTEMLEFSAKMGDKSPLAGRKSSADCLFTAAEEIEMAFEEDTPAPEAGKFTQAMAALVARFTGQAQSADERFNAMLEAIKASADAYTAQNTKLSKLEGDLAALQGKYTAQAEELAGFKKLLDTTDANKHSQRPPATGGKGGETENQF